VDIPAVVSALNLNGLGVARALGRHGVRVIGVSEGEPGPEAKSRHVKEIWSLPRGADLVETLLFRGRGLGVSPVLFPITDSAVSAIAARQADIRAVYRLGMPATETVEALIDKRGFHARATELGFPVPQSFDVASPEELEAAGAKLRFPCIMKPQVKSEAYAQSGAKKAYVLDDRPSLLETYRRFAHLEPRVMIQEYIPGGDNEVYFCLQYWSRSGELWASFAGHKIRQWPPHCGGTAACEPLQSPEVEELTTRFFRAVRFEGLCSMEYKRDPRTGAFFMIEPTVARTDWQSAVADLNGVPIPWAAYCDLSGAPRPHLVPDRVPKKWVHLGADRLSAAQHQQEGELDRLRWLWSLRPPLVEAYISLEDPGPALSILAGKVGGKLRRPRRS
jgi:predicted ATP-grasp superfamily ATP-dependent carboligase